MIAEVSLWGRTIGAVTLDPGNRAAAARELGIARSYLYTLVAKHGLQPQGQLVA